MNEVVRRSRLVRSIFACACLYLILAQLSIAAEPKPTSSVDSISIVVRDLDRATEFFVKTLEFEVESPSASVAGTPAKRTQRSANLRLGDERIRIVESPGACLPSIPADSHSNDLWFQHLAIVVSDMGRAYDRLKSFQVKHISVSPQRLPDWNVSAGGIEAFYFQSPEGHVLELIHFPPGRGAEKWHAETDRLFLGIDHTAIAVANSERSIAFYRDTAGFNVAGRSENWGIEQDRLSGVPGARVRITTLRGQSGPGVELLEYLAPRTGREWPTDEEQRRDVPFWSIAIHSDALMTCQTSHLNDPDGHRVSIQHSSAGKQE